MSLSKRLEEAVREGRMTEAKAIALLERREAEWARKEKTGQLLLGFGFEKGR